MSLLFEVISHELLLRLKTTVHVHHNADIHACEANTALVSYAPIMNEVCTHLDTLRVGAYLYCCKHGMRCFLWLRSSESPF